MRKLHRTRNETNSSLHCVKVSARDYFQTSGRVADLRGFTRVDSVTNGENEFSQIGRYIAIIFLFQCFK